MEGPLIVAQEVIGCRRMAGVPIPVVIVEQAASCAAVASITAIGGVCRRGVHRGIINGSRIVVAVAAIVVVVMVAPSMTATAPLDRCEGLRRRHPGGSRTVAELVLAHDDGSNIRT